MRAYRTSAGIFVGTQADAGPAYARIDIPEDKAGLLNFLNALATAPRSGAEAAEPVDYKAAIAAAIGGTVPVEIELFIQSADPATLRNLSESCICRLRELLAELPK